MAEKTLIVGLGQIGVGYDVLLSPEDAVYTHARALSMHPSFELACGVDPDKKNRERFEKIYACPAYAKVEEALAAHNIGVAVIATPTSDHAKTLRKILSFAGIKAILCEKPLSMDLSEARSMIQLCEERGVLLFVNYIRRADPGAIEVKRRIDERCLEGPLKGVVWYSKGFLHNGSHFFNLLEYWLGPYSSAQVFETGRLWDNFDPEPGACVEFEQGKIVFLAAWEEAYSHYTIEILSPSGRLKYEQGGELILWQGTQADPNVPGYKTLNSNPEIIPNGMNRYQWHVVDELSEALAGSASHLCTGRQALQTLEAMHQIINQR